MCPTTILHDAHDASESCLGFGCEGLWYDDLLNSMYDLDIKEVLSWLPQSNLPYTRSLP